MGPSELNPSLFAHLDELRRPRHNRWSQRRDAALALTLLPLSDEERKQACRTLRDILTRTNHEAFWRKVVRGFVRPLYVIGPFYLFMALAALPTDTANPLIWSWHAIAQMAILSLGGIGLVLSPIGVPLSLAHDAGTENRVRAAAADALGELKDPASLLALAEGLRDSSSVVRHACARALDLLLPIPGQVHLAPSPTLSAALGLGLSRNHAPPTVKLLGLMEYVGIGQELPAIRHLEKYGITEEIREAAHRAAEAVERRIAEGRDRALLLRATSTPDTADSLLRPASDAGSQDESVLLRPTD
jgi:hypothetical protein